VRPRLTLTNKNVVDIWLFDEIKGYQAKDKSENRMVKSRARCR